MTTKTTGPQAGPRFDRETGQLYADGPGYKCQSVTYTGGEFSQYATALRELATLVEELEDAKDVDQVRISFGHNGGGGKEKVTMRATHRIKVE